MYESISSKKEGKNYRLYKMHIPRNSFESVPAELQAAQIEFPGAIKFGFKMSAISRELSSGSGPRAE